MYRSQWRKLGRIKANGPSHSPALHLRCKMEEDWKNEWQSYNKRHKQWLRPYWTEKILGSRDEARTFLFSI